MDDRIDRVMLEARGGRAEIEGGPSDPLLRARLWDNPCWLSFRVNYLSLAFTSQVYGQVQDRHGLLRPDVVVLWSLYLLGETAFSDIVRAVGFPKNTLSRAARKLEELGLVLRLEDADDQRRVRLRLTDAGVSLSTTLRDLMMTHEARMLEPLTPAERLALSDLLTKLVVHAAGLFPLEPAAFPQTAAGEGSKAVPAAADGHPNKRERP